MSRPDPVSRWMKWESPFSRQDPETEATKPSKPGFEGSEGSGLGDSEKIGAAGATPNDSWKHIVAYAEDLLNYTGTIIMDLNDAATVGIWADLDSPSIRDALRILGKDNMPIRYLDGDGIPGQYKLRKVDGECVPWDVLQAMQAEPEKPWTRRDEMLRNAFGRRTASRRCNRRPQIQPSAISWSPRTIVL
jgi:hypothetical protein